MHSNPLFLNITETPKPKLTVDPTWTEFFPSEKITLKCGFDGGSSGWSFQWIKDGHSFDNPDSQPKIITVNLTDSGQYTCKGILYNRPVNTQESNAFLLKVNEEKPKPNVQMNPAFDVLYNPETVTLNCNIQSIYTEWEYIWYKNSKEAASIISRKGSHTINSVQLSDNGIFWCQAKRDNFYSMHSNPLFLNITETPKPKLTVDPTWTEFFPSEKITLKCGFDGGSSGWSFQWIKDGHNFDNPDSQPKIITVNLTDSGQYTCKGILYNRPVNTQESNAFLLKVNDHWPKPLLSQNPDFQVIYTKEQVTFNCEVKVQSSEWEYLWFNDSELIHTDTSKNYFTIKSAQVTDGRKYCCKVRRRDLSSDQSDIHTLTVKEPPQTNVSIESQWKTFYATEKVTLKCSINGISDEWNYEWFKNETHVSKDKDISLIGTTLSINLAKKSHSGWYTCRGKHVKRLPVTTSKAEALRLQIYDKTPKPKTGKHPSFDFFYTEEQVQLDCSMPGDGWEYHWYENSKRTQPPSTDPTYNISSASLSHTFYCKAKRGDFSVHSENVEVNVKNRPTAVLTLETEWGDIMAGNILTLKCEIIDEREWNYTWYENGLKLNGSLDIYKVTATEETIKSEFKCKGIRTERPLYSAMSEGFIANNTVFKRKILLAISGCLICCIVILIIGCVILKCTRKSEKKETYRVTEDLFFSMADSKNQTAAPMKEYMDNKPTDSEMKECDEKELLSDCISTVHVDGVIKDEDAPSTEANGLTSFKGT
ncbi:Fc receptor-like protein 5 isoform X2 [Xyrauchen texanus]|uniref:Fc receptor-like protein 5 isoform X2 n=1 Tax=Xyrauchen texanus TaxID=154827 RepID=UPI002241D492|nr:Fc receptor-like protein 5 isoform X2 [Xyrauchen texanus]